MRAREKCKLNNLEADEFFNKEISLIYFTNIFVFFKGIKSAHRLPLVVYKQQRRRVHQQKL
jgi:hypothetical protein